MEKLSKLNWKEQVAAYIYLGAWIFGLICLVADNSTPKCMLFGAGLIAFVTLLYEVLGITEYLKRRLKD